MSDIRDETTQLKTEIAYLRQELARVSGEIRLTESDTRAGGSQPLDGSNLYVFDEDDEEAKAFDEFYRTHDEVHAKTRRFLLG